MTRRVWLFHNQTQGAEELTPRTGLLDLAHGLLKANVR
jgi:hypothetical protein